MNDNIKILIQTISSVFGGLFLINYGYKLIDQEKMSIWIFIISGLLGAISTWFILKLIIEKINKQ
jgi:hypothetical protein